MGPLRIFFEKFRVAGEAMRTGTKESRKYVRANCEDRLSHLPDGIISNILSRLPTKVAVRTCVLSKDWEYKWTSIYIVSINDRHYKRLDEVSFVNIVERILLLSQNIKVFRLLCSNNYRLRSRLTTWITTLLRGNVESFELRNMYEEAIVLPRNLLNNSSLRKLHLWISCSFKVPPKNYFANLKCLYLHEVEITKELSSTDTLTFTFPVLETFEWRYCKWMNVKTVEIFAPSLTSFVSETDELYVEILDYTVKIFAPKLVYFESFGGSAENFIMDGKPVVKAVLHHQDIHGDIHGDLQMLGYYGLQFRRLLKEFTNLEELKLTIWVAEAIADAKQGLALPRNDKLRQLVFELGFDIEALLEFLHSAPSLTSLILDLVLQHFS